MYNDEHLHRSYSSSDDKLSICWKLCTAAHYLKWRATFRSRVIAKYVQKRAEKTVVLHAADLK